MLARLDVDGKDLLIHIESYICKLVPIIIIKNQFIPQNKHNASLCQRLTDCFCIGK
jgi:hypothetical protein